ncbi:MAG: YraN family protein [Eubacteriales bacterium]|jgi:putative endonuclease|nr:YraN family protein [Eubacteriales bacterium]MDD3289653.1 YraN family protein [Eubacteriales bacterium]MDD3863742.1 YraN family protein [Eubacteriales bacterium]MDD4445760.1 YraN family protein [Eubacteriales bacterium]
MDKKQLGTWGEGKAVGYLKAGGYHVLERNFRCRWGEIDIIALRDKVLCFIEVKTRTSLEYGLPCQAVGPGKQDHIRRAALAYVHRNPDCAAYDFRMDVIELLRLPRGDYIRHVTGAF